MTSCEVAVCSSTLTVECTSSNTVQHLLTALMWTANTSDSNRLTQRVKEVIPENIGIYMYMKDTLYCDVITHLIDDTAIMIQ